MIASAPLILSVSQAEQFDSRQVGGCQRRWYFERVEGRRPEKTTAHGDGDVGHELFATHLRGEQLPKRARMLKAVRGALKNLPTPGLDLLVERRFDGRPKRDAVGAWIPVDPKCTLWLGGVAWDGFVDLRYRRNGVVSVWDHKFSSEIHTYAKLADQLIHTVQMPVYCLDSLRLWPDATKFQLVHHYVSRRGVDSFLRAQTVTLEQVMERAADVEWLVGEIQTVRRAPSAEDVPYNRRACDAYMGCPHQSICSGFKGKKMNLSKEDLELFGMLEAVGPTPVELVENVTHARDPLVDAGHGAGDEFGGDDFPLPTASTPAAQPPVCGKCGTELHRENGSERDGVWRHINCPANAQRPETASAARDAEALASERAKPLSAGKLGALAEQCGECPHSAHPGVPCPAKRGRGTCRCGQAVAAPVESPPQRVVPPAPKFVQSAEELRKQADEAAKAADMDGDGATVEEARVLREAAEQAEREELLQARSAASLPFAQAAHDDVTAPLIPANITVTVLVELGPATLAFLAGLVKR